MALRPNPALRVVACIASAVLAGGSAAQGGETLFGRAFTAETVAPGDLELLQLTRYRDGRAFGRYKAVDLNFAAEYGLAKDWQASVNFGLLRIDAAAAADEGDPDGATGFTRHGWYVRGLAAEIAHTVRDPETAGWGLAFAGEIEAILHAPKNGLSYEGSFGVGFRAILETRWFDDRLIAVYNLALEYETVRFNGRQDRHDKFDWDNEIGLSWLEQLYGTPNGYDVDGVFIGDRLSLLEHERREITLKLGVSL